MFPAVSAKQNGRASLKKERSCCVCRRQLEQFLILAFSLDTRRRPARDVPQFRPLTVKWEREAARGPGRRALPRGGIKGAEASIDMNSEAR